MPRAIAEPPKVFILRMRNVPAMDSSGVHALLDVVKRARKDGIVVLLSGVHVQPLAVLTDSEAVETIGSENIVGNLDLALARAREVLGASVSGAAA